MFALNKTNSQVFVRFLHCAAARNGKIMFYYKTKRVKGEGGGVKSMLVSFRDKYLVIWVLCRLDRDP